MTLMAGGSLHPGLSQPGTGSAWDWVCLGLLGPDRVGSIISHYIPHMTIPVLSQATMLLRAVITDHYTLAFVFVMRVGPGVMLSQELGSG